MVDVYRALRELEHAVKDLPLARAWKRRQYERLFASDAGYGYFRGVYATFDEALRSAPKNRPLGCDLDEYARMFDERHDRVFSYDYPVLFWLRSILTQDARIFDFGGHVGVQFYGYQTVLPLPAGVRWQVCDVPAVVSQGRSIAQARGQAHRLTFTTDVLEASGADVFIAAGSLQFVEAPPLAQSLQRLDRLPRHLLLNKLPLRDGPSYVTLQNAGASFVAQHVFERRVFIDGLTALGYTLVDAWEDRVHSCSVPFHPEQSVAHYSGLYLRLPSSAS